MQIDCAILPATYVYVLVKVKAKMYTKDLLFECTIPTLGHSVHMIELNSC